MKILRSIAAIIAGWFVSILVIGIIEFVNFAAFRPNDGTPLFAKAKLLAEDKAAMQAHLRSMPESALYAVVVAWIAGATLGGAVAARIAGRAPVIHAGIIGVIVVASTIANAAMMKRDYDYVHPEWALFVGLILAACLSLAAGVAVAKLRPVPPANPAAPVGAA
jgi:hypothetical protein